MSVVFVLTKEYLDNSSFSIHGVTTNIDFATAWVISGNEGDRRSRAYSTVPDVVDDEPIGTWFPHKQTKEDSTIEPVRK